MRYTSAEANKLLRKIERRIRDIEQKEQKSKSFRVASGEDTESLRPPYDFAGTQAELDRLEDMAREVKHAVNIFNVTHTLPGFDDVTIDRALVFIPQMSRRVDKLREMAGAIPKSRIDDFRSSFADYKVVNYDIAEAEEAYRAANDMLAELQLALDAANTTAHMEIDVFMD